MDYRIVNDMMASPVVRRGLSLSEVLIALAVAATLLAVGAPVVRTSLAEQRLQAGSADVGTALAEARREAFRGNTSARVEVDPADGRISVFATDTRGDAAREVERKRYFLPAGIRFTNVAGVTSFVFDRRGKPVVLPLTIQVGIANTATVRTVSVLRTGQTTGM